MSKLLVEVQKIRHARDARRIEAALNQQEGIRAASVSVPGTLYLEYDDQETRPEDLLAMLPRLGLKVVPEPDTASPPPRIEAEEEPDLPFQFLGENTEIILAIGSGIFWGLGVVASFLPGVSAPVPIALFVVASLLGGFFTVITTFQDLRRGRFEIDFLMLFAAVGAAALGKWGEGALLLFLFSLGHALEHYAMKRARKSIAALSDLAPPMALLKRGSTVVETRIEDLNIGDVILVRPNSKIAADGVVAKGSSSVDQSPITGESVPVDKRESPRWTRESEIGKLPPEHRVFAGSINGSGALEVKVLKLAHDSTLSRLITLVREAETQKSPTQRLADRFETVYVPIVLAVVVLLLFAFLVLDETFGESFYRAMAVLIAASPCALAISTPSAVLAGIARAARQGVLIKGGLPLEDLGSVRAIAFDKTGTLTQGRPVLTRAIPVGGTERAELLRMAMAVEALSDHPLAAAIVEGGRAELGPIELPAANNLQALTARGVRAEVESETVHIGNRRLFEELTGVAVPPEIDRTMSELEAAGHTAMIVHHGGDYLGVVSVMDVARPESAATLQALKAKGIERMVMLTGDHQQVANAIAADLGITDPLGSLLPEDKVAAIERLRNETGGVAMVGDGVNDAPAMARSTVGIAMGAAGSDVALETADIALMADKLDNLPFAIGLSRKARQIIKQNLVISLGMVAILVPSTLFGFVPIGPAVVGHEGSTLLVVLNALRLLRYHE